MLKNNPAVDRRTIGFQPNVSKAYLRNCLRMLMPQQSWILSKKSTCA